MTTYDHLPDNTKLVRVDYLATMTGFSPRCIREWHSKGLMPKATRLGNRLFWPADVIAQWIRDGCPHQRSKPPGLPFKKKDFLEAEASAENETLREVITEYGSRHNA